MTAPSWDKNAAAKFVGTLETLPDNWVMCRDVMHAWDVMNDFHVPQIVLEKGGSKRLNHVARELMCNRCGTVRHEMYVVTKGRGLEKISQSYAYPQGYQIPGVPRGVKPKSLIQQVQYRKAMEKVANAALGEKETADR